MTNGISSIDSIKFNFRCHTLAYCNQNYGSEYQIQWATIHAKRSWHHNILEPPPPRQYWSRENFGDSWRNAALFASLGTLRYTTAGCYYGYFGREGPSWQLRFLLKLQTHKDFAVRQRGVQYLRVFTKMDTFDFILLLYDKGLINDNDFLLLCWSYVSQNFDLTLSRSFRTACNSNHKTK